MAELMKKYKAAVQQQSVDQINLQDQSTQLEELSVERETLKEQVNIVTRLHPLLYTALIWSAKNFALEPSWSVFVLL